ncbi:MAG: NAD(P)-binding protein [Lachnospiraceae bacterium]|nr:NAD(P)-binding protein [Lachnospiraceae bacterium]
MLKFLIIGGGPAGLTFANMLKQKGESDFLLIEKENVAGGLCRSVDVDGSPLDIGGGHFLDVRRPEVNKFLFSFMPENEWNVYDRDSRINIKGQLIHHPIEANIWEMDIESQISYLKSISQAGCNVGSSKPDKFTDWIRWKLGDKIADDYMLPYNRKMFGKNLDVLGTYWLEKLPDVSFEDTLRSCLVHKAYAKQPGHARFYYPKKFGYGELWKRMSLALGDNIKLGESVIDIDFDNRSIRTDKSEYQAQNIITTIPWKTYKELKGMPDSIKAQVDKLLHTSVCIEYYADNLDTTAHWVYYPDPELSYHRVLVRSNFCDNSRGYWTETNKDRVLSKGEGTFSYMNEYAYPLNTIEKKEAITEILDWSKTKGVYGLGRWGEHEHYNSDLTVELSMRMAEKIIK